MLVGEATNPGPDVAEAYESCSEDFADEPLFDALRADEAAAAAAGGAGAASEAGVEPGGGAAAAMPEEVEESSDYEPEPLPHAEVATAAAAADGVPPAGVAVPGTPMHSQEPLVSPPQLTQR